MADIIPQKWQELNNNKQMMENIIKICKHHDEGGVLCIKYDSDKPVFAFVPKHDWSGFEVLKNFNLLIADYDPSIHYILCLSVNDNYQLARLNYNQI